MAGPATGFPPELPTFLFGRDQTVYQSADRLPESEHETLANGWGNERSPIFIAGGNKGVCEKVANYFTGHKFRRKKGPKD